MERRGQRTSAGRRLAILAVAGLMAVGGGIWFALPASAAADFCFEPKRPRFGMACILATPHPDGTQLLGDVFDTRDDTRSTLLTVRAWVIDFNEPRDLYVYAADDVRKVETFQEFYPHQLEWVQLRLCRVNRENGTRRCFRSAQTNL